MSKLHLAGLTGSRGKMHFHSIVHAAPTTPTGEFEVYVVANGDAYKYVGIDRPRKHRCSPRLCNFDARAERGGYSHRLLAA